MIRGSRSARLASGLLATGLVLSLAACGGSKPAGQASVPAEDENARGPITYVIGKDTTGNMQKELDAWNAAHPNEKATLIELPDSADQQRLQMVRSFQTKGSDYTVLGADIVWTAEFAANGWVQELSAGDYDLDKFVPGAVDSAKYRNKLYGVPQVTNAAFLYYRKDLLEKVGAKPPTTVEEMKAACAKIRALPEAASMSCFAPQFNKYEGLTVNFSEAIMSAGGQVVDASGAPKVNTPESQKGLEWMVEAVKDGTIPKEALTWKEEESRRAFQEGKAIFHRNWPHVYSQASKTDGSSQVAGKFGIAPIPGVGGPGVSSLGGSNLMVNRFGKNKATARDFIKYMTSEDVMRTRTLATSRAAARTATYTDPKVTEKLDYMPILLDALKVAKPRPQVVKYGDVTAAVQDSTYAALQGQKLPAEALADLQKRLETIIK
ncbi:ABC transporter substrate-binding protein [Mariniluteicoccus flavus]